jgi:hypothetical protein
MTGELLLGGAESFVVETWFGLGAAEFLISSIHGFEVNLEDRGESSALRCVRFGFSG